MAEDQEIKIRVFEVEVPEDWDLYTYDGLANAVYQIPYEERSRATKFELLEAGEAENDFRQITIRATFDESKWTYKREWIG